MHTLKLRHEITIHALTSKVWKVITFPEYTQQFLFDGELVSEWVAGASILLEEEKEGRKWKVEKGRIGEMVPGISLQFTLHDSGAPANDPVHFHFELVPGDDGIRLILVQEVISRSEELHRMLNENCRMMLQKIKWLAEYS